MTAQRFPGPASSLLLALALLPGRANGQQASGVPAPATPAAQGGVAHAADEPSPFRITGRVINSLSKAAVGRAEITVSPMGARRSNGRFAGRAQGQTAAAITDAEGRFSVDVPSAGGWSVSAAAHGYRTQAFEEHGGFSTAVILTDANPVYEVLFPLTPASAIEGYVLDEAGEAIRNAQLTASLVPPPTPEDQHPRRQQRGIQRTDDRGYYKFSGLLSGSYNVRVQAQPWYASNGAATIQGGIGAIAGGISGVSGNVALSVSGAPATGRDAAAADPLDVVYPVVWYPGVTDSAAATPIMLRGGETKEADFRLLPVPGFHLRVAEKPTAADEHTGGVDPRLFRNTSYLSQILPDGTEVSFPTPAMEANGAMEFSGLAPGTYIVHRQSEGDAAGTATIRIAENSARTLDVSQATPAVPITVKVDTEADMPSLQISFRDVESGRVSFVQGQRESGGRGVRRGRGSEGAVPEKTEDAADRSINLPPGRYEVTLNGINDLHLTSIEAKGATATGRTVTIAGGAPVLTLHVASGRANVTGFVQSHGKPVEGAMVLLVPATLGDPSGLDVTRRDQSNTDGSFDMTGVLPGAYILVAIDHGWDVNWSDPAALRRFLMRGVPLDLSKSGERKETVEAQSP